MTASSNKTVQTTQTVTRGGHEIFSIRPATAYFYADGALALLKSLAFVFALFLLEKFIQKLPGGDNFFISFWISLAGGLFFLAGVLRRHWQRNSVRYTLTDSALTIEDGFFRRQTRHIPLAALRGVTVFAGLKQRLIGCGDILIENLHEPRGKIVLRSIAAPKKIAGEILRQTQTAQNQRAGQNFPVSANAASR